MATHVSLEPERGHYDYIVCGYVTALFPATEDNHLTKWSGGTSGLVTAARLAEDPNNSVLVIEAGQHNSLLEQASMAGGW